MNEDYSEILNKFTEILKEKNIDLNNIVNNNTNDSTCDENSSDFQFDINTILKIKQIFNNMNNNNNTRNQLLFSLKPYLKDEKKEKLEQYIKIANLISVLDSLDDNHFFSFIKNEKNDYILLLILFLLIF